MSEIEFLANKIQEKSNELMNKISSIIEMELRKVCEDFGIPPEKVILQCYPEGIYSIGVIVSKFKIENEFTWENKESKYTNKEV